MSTDDRTHTEGVLAEVYAERRRQVGSEGWTTTHDDGHTDESLAAAGACYALAADENEPEPEFWPWDWADWKPKDRRRNLVRAAALIVAEIERLDRTERIDRPSPPRPPGTFPGVAG